MVDPHKYSNPWQLTPREEECISLLGAGTGALAVGVQMGLSLATVRGLIARATGKMGAHSALGACIAYERWSAQRRALTLAQVVGLVAQAGLTGRFESAARLVRAVERAQGIEE